MSSLVQSDIVLIQQVHRREEETGFVRVWRVVDTVLNGRQNFIELFRDWHCYRDPIFIQVPKQRVYVDAYPVIIIVPTVIDIKTAVESTAFVSFSGFRTVCGYSDFTLVGGTA